MKQMSDKFFVDTNILIYTVGNIMPKKDIAVGLITGQTAISTQVITETINVMYRKLKYEYSEIRIVINKFIEEMELYAITGHTIRTALNIAEKYGYSYFDSQIIASALEHDCSVLYSEDMQHNQIIEKRLRIINPFLPSS
jgi:predicted nucleic acid-binding protein